MFRVLELARSGSWGLSWSGKIIVSTWSRSQTQAKITDHRNKKLTPER